uniref:C3H1-type domain-containing protein n=1 Tax=Tanacetum cinerariifolium TaxID=118510 RepID=A0A699IS18_TANCI|nr:hypothetical protein [Tanacetum cinerariifolium]
MTGSDATLLPTPLSEKLSLEYFLEKLCASYDVEKYLHTPTTETGSTSLVPLTPGETKVDKIVLSWILFTLSDSLRARLVVARPKSAKEAWNLISDLVKDNKRSRTNALKPRFNYAKGTCRYGDSCRYVHDPNVRLSNTNKGGGNTVNSTNELLTHLLAKLGHINLTSTMPNVTASNSNPVAFYTRPSPHVGLVQNPPPGFPQMAQAQVYYNTAAGPNPIAPPQFVPSAAGPT